MERTFADDLRAAVLILSGATLGYLLVGADDPWLLLGGLIGVVLVTIVANILRRVSPRRRV
jgi:F0F1-type ATP synthase assembly protein I